MHSNPCTGVWHLVKNPVDYGERPELQTQDSDTFLFEHTKESVRKEPCANMENTQKG